MEDKICKSAGCWLEELQKWHFTRDPPPRKH